MGGVDADPANPDSLYTKVQVGNAADVNLLSGPLLVILPSYVIAQWHGADRWG